MSPIDPLEHLVSTLIAQTSQDRIVWEPANFMETAFIARRPSGTVVVEDGAFGGAFARLTVRDEHGNALQQLSASTSSLGIAGASHAGGAVPALYQQIIEQRARQRETIEKLAKEFESS